MKGARTGPLKGEIKHVKGVSCVNPCLSVPTVKSAPSVVNSLSVGGRLQKFWQIWEKMGANPRVVAVLKEGCTLPFKMRPPSHKVTSGQERLCKPRQEPASKRSIASSSAKVGRGESGCPVIPSLLQLVVLSTVQTQPSDPDRVVPISAGVQSLVLKMGLPHVDLFATWFNHKLPKFVSLVLDQTGWAVDALSLPWENLDAYAFPPVSMLSQVISKDGSRLLQNDSDSSRVVQHALVLGPSHSIVSDPLQLPLQKNLVTTLQWAPSQEPQQSESSCLAPRASAIQEQGFSD